MLKLSQLTTFIHSIRFRLVLWFTIILTLVLFAFSGFIYFNQMRDIRGENEFIHRPMDCGGARRRGDGGERAWRGDDV